MYILWGLIREGGLISFFYSRGGGLMKEGGLFERGAYLRGGLNREITVSIIFSCRESFKRFVTKCRSREQDGPWLAVSFVSKPINFIEHFMFVNMPNKRI